MQLTLTGEKKEMWFCSHCSWYGFDPLIVGEHELCPKCDWVAYSEKEIEHHGFTDGITMPQLTKNYNRAKKIKK
ncbi:MAG: hypothetical protein ACOC5T_07085 [Elusimicrobiota bacterium]